MSQQTLPPLPTHAGTVCNDGYWLQHKDGPLAKLPRGASRSCDFFTADQMREYALAAIEAAQQQVAATAQEIRNAALEEAAEACMRTTPDRLKLRVIGEAGHYIACADAIRKLKSAPPAQDINAELLTMLRRARKHIMEWWRPDDTLPPARSPDLVEDIEAVIERATKAQTAAAPAQQVQASQQLIGDHDFPLELVERVRNACTSMGIATSPSMEECSIKLKDMLYSLCRSIERWHKDLKASQPQDSITDALALLTSLANDAEEKRKVETNPNLERILLGMRDAYDHAVRIVSKHRPSSAQAEHAKDATPNEQFAIVMDRSYDGEGLSLAVHDGINYAFSDGDCFNREGDTLDGYTAEFLTLHQLEKKMDEQAKDAARYRWLMRKVCGICNRGFDFVNLPPMPENWRHGSIAQHFTTAIDAAMANSDKVQG